MLTIFTILRPFRGHYNIIQRNAIQSWRNLYPECQIILFGDEEGIGNISAEYHTLHIPNIPRSEYGTPLVDFMFEQAERNSTNRLVAYVNSDIILLQDILYAVSHLTYVDKFLMCGQHCDLDITEQIYFLAPHWEWDLRQRVMKEGKLHPTYGFDYYLYPKGMFGKLPPITIGRNVLDNWLLYKARTLKVPVIDATNMITCIRQNHEHTYNSVNENSPQVIEAHRNEELLGGLDNALTLEYATHIITPYGLKPALSFKHIYFRLRAMTILHRNIRWLLGCFKVFEMAIATLRKMRDRNVESDK